MRAYGQRDPLVEYKKEGLRLFKEMEENIENSILGTLAKIDESTVTTMAQKSIENQALKITTSDDSGGSSPVARRTTDEIGRNDPCPCGSGKKWKKCGMLNTEEHQRLMANKK